MPTYVQSEIVQRSAISEQTPHWESKHDRDQRYKKKHELALYKRDLRELGDYPIMEYQHDLTDALWNPYDNIKDDIKNWNFRNISEEEALNTPFKA